MVEDFWTDAEIDAHYISEPTLTRPYPSLTASIRNALNCLFVIYPGVVLEFELLNFLLKNDPFCKYLVTNESIQKYTVRTEGAHLGDSTGSSPRDLLLSTLFSLMSTKVSAI